MTEPITQQLAEIHLGILYTRWGRSDFHGDPSMIISEDFVNDCDHCFNVRLKKWRKVKGLI